MERGEFVGSSQVSSAQLLKVEFACKKDWALATSIHLDCEIEMLITHSDSKFYDENYWDCTRNCFSDNSDDNNRYW